MLTDKSTQKTEVNFSGAVISGPIKQQGNQYNVQKLQLYVAYTVSEKC